MASSLEFSVDFNDYLEVLAFTHVNLDNLFKVNPPNGLISLLIDDCGLTSIPTSFFQDMSRLEEIGLQNNNLQSVKKFRSHSLGLLNLFIF